MGIYYGIDENEDLKPGLLKKDTRGGWAKAKGSLVTDLGLVLKAIGAVTILSSFYPGASLIHEYILLACLFIYILMRKVSVGYDFFKPAKAKGKGGKISNSEGMFFLSNNLTKYNREAWVSRDLASTHWLVFGSTGSGKTRFLLGIFYQVCMYGGGCIYVDGKGDNTVWWLFYSMARKVGREEDVLLMSYLTGESTGKKISNTCHPFKTGTATEVASIIVGLMRDGGGDDIWKGRAVAMLKALAGVLVDKRDRGEMELNISNIRDHVTLDKIVEIAQEENIEPAAAKEINTYLESIPGFKWDDMLMGKLSAKCYEQHGYLQMQLTEVMGDLASTYSHIYGAETGEISFPDVIFKKRLLFVILPALQKNPDELSGLGKMVVSSIKGALSSALGVDVEGNKIDVLESKPNNAEIPFTIILDEYGYYAVEGFAVVAAQARSLGVQVVYAGQDYGSLKKGSEIEAAATVANTNIKIAMKIEDMGETADTFISRAGEADVTLKSGDERKVGLFDGYREQDTTRIERRKRIDGRDLVAQAPGQAHVLIQDTLERVQLFYADPVETEDITINTFVAIKRVGNDVIKELKRTEELIESSLSQGPLSTDEFTGDESISDTFRWLKMAKDFGMDNQNASVHALGCIMADQNMDDLNLEREVLSKKAIKEKARQKPTTTQEEVPATKTEHQISGQKQNTQKIDLKTEAASEPSRKNLEETNAREKKIEFTAAKNKVNELEYLETETDQSVQEEARQSENNFIKLLGNAVKTKSYLTEKRVTNEEDDEVAETLKSIEDSANRSYPPERTPKKPKKEELDKKLSQIISQINKNNM